jgi:hypothetical protein
MEDQHNYDATGRDPSRQDATATDMDFTLSLEEVAERYARAGHARTLRSLQRYCASGHLDAQKIATTTGDKYLVTPQSVARHIAQIKEFAALDAVATFRDQPRPVATDVTPQRVVDSTPLAVPNAAPEHDMSRHVATRRDSYCASNGDGGKPPIATRRFGIRQAATSRDRNSRDRRDVVLCRSTRTAVGKRSR